MKKPAALLVIIVVLMLSVIPVAGDGVSVSTEAGDRISLFEEVRITSPVYGNVISVLGNVSVDSNINGQVIAVFGDVNIAADVSAQVVTVFGNTYLADGAVVQGNVITIGSLNKSAGARVLGQEVRILGETMNLDIDAIVYLRLFIMAIFTLAVLIVGLLVLAIYKRQYINIANNIESNTGKKLLLGFLSFLGASILLILLLATLIAPILYIVALVLSTITASMYTGRLILKAFSRANSIYMEFITGLISITLVKLLLLFLIPQQDLLLGMGLMGLFDILVFSVGLGIYMEERYSSI